MILQEVIDKLKQKSARWDSEVAIGNRGAYYAQEAYETAIELLEQLQREAANGATND